MSRTKYLGCEETIEEKREKALREQTEAEERYQALTKTLHDFEDSVFHLVEDDAIRARRQELRAARQKAYDEMREARELVNFTHRCSSVGNKPPAYRPEIDRGDWIKR
jgi:predicted  nucleic acid-binding Zn-ribbon protein